MSETTEGVELALPAEAFLALSRLTAPKTDAGPVTVVRAIAAPVVAAELRRLAVRYFDPRSDPDDGECVAYSAVSNALRARADELEAQS